MSARIIRPGRWNDHGVAEPIEMDNEVPMPPPVIRAPSMPPRHRPRVQRQPRGSFAVRLVLLVALVAGVSAALIVHANTPARQECSR